MVKRFLLSVLPLLLMSACMKETPVKVERQDLGITVIFPGQPAFRSYEENTPFGRMEWWSHAYTGGRMDESFHTEVGNVPPGPMSATVPAVLKTLDTWLTRRLGALKREDLVGAAGPGFTYQVPGPSGRAIAGVIVVRRGRIHHAQATVKDASDPRLRTFMDSFTVAP